MRVPTTACFEFDKLRPVTTFGKLLLIDGGEHADLNSYRAELRSLLHLVARRLPGRTLAHSWVRGPLLGSRFLPPRRRRDA